MKINLEGTIKKINMMGDNKEKYRLYNNLLWTLSFLFQNQTLKSDDLDYYLNLLEDQQKVKKIFTLSKEKQIIDIHQNAGILNQLFYPILQDNKNYSFYQDYYPYYDFNKSIYHLEEFLYEMGDDIFNLYQMLIKQELIIEKYHHDKYASCGHINGELSAIILEINLEPLFKAITIAHEMGHAYDNYLNKTQDYHRAYQINSEVTSMTFELLFLYYLDTHHYLKKEHVNICYRNYYTDYLLRMHNAYVHNALILNNKLDNLSFEEILEYSIINNKQAQRNLQNIDFINNYYGFGLILASYFFKEFQTNPQNTMKEIRNFSCLSNSLNTQEIIEYFDLPKTLKKASHKML